MHHKKKKKHKVSGTPVRRRKARVSGINSNALINFAIAQVGFLVAEYATTMAPAEWDKNYVGAGKLAAGALPLLMKNADQKLVAFGVGVGVSGTRDLAVNNGLISGVPMQGDDLLAVDLGKDYLDVDFEEVKKLNGVDVLAGGQDILAGDISVINGDLSVMNGSEDEQIFLTDY